MKRLQKFRSIAAAILMIAAAVLIAPLLMKTANTPAVARQTIDPLPVTCLGASAEHFVMTVFCPDSPIDIEIHTDREIFITNTCVVNDPCRTRWDITTCDHTTQGAWTFGKLMASMANFSSIDEDPVNLSRFVTNWLLLFNA